MSSATGEVHTHLSNNNSRPSSMSHSTSLFHYLLPLSVSVCVCLRERGRERERCIWQPSLRLSVGQKGNALRMTSISAAAEQFSYTRTYLAPCTPCTPSIYPTHSPLHILNNLSVAAAFGLTAGWQRYTENTHAHSQSLSLCRLLLFCSATPPCKFWQFHKIWTVRDKWHVSFALSLSFSFAAWRL